MITKDKRTIAGMVLSATTLGMLAWFMCLLVGGCGCVHVTPDPGNGIPRFSWVDEANKICRGGQPTLQGWYWLQNQQIDHVIKLNDEAEASDSVAWLQLGMSLDYDPISLEWQINPLFHDKLDRYIHETLHMVRPKTFVHCQNGEDRTGAFCYAYRRNNGWSDSAARTEMETNGFHYALLGLRKFVDEYVPVLSATNATKRLVSPKATP